MKSIIVGTAGHIDHGKTALVRALIEHGDWQLAESYQLTAVSFRFLASCIELLCAAYARSTADLLLPTVDLVENNHLSEEVPERFVNLLVRLPFESVNRRVVIRAVGYEEEAIFQTLREDEIVVRQFGAPLCVLLSLANLK